ncbi:MAG: hypothetical protein ABIF77_00440 [bacterium]
MAPEELGPYECIDPELGEYVWQLDDPDLEPGLREQVTHHIEICDRCRWERDAELRLARDLLAGRLRFDTEGSSADPVPLRRHPLFTPRVGWAGVALLAACLALLVFLPPRVPSGDAILRDGEMPYFFLRPVEGEVVSSRQPTLQWTPVDGASGYRVVLQQIGGDYRWETRTETTTSQPSTEQPLPASGRFRAILQTIPADLVPAEDITVTFRTGSLGALCRYRLTVAPLWVLLLGSGGLLLLLGSLVRRRQTA